MISYAQNFGGRHPRSGSQGCRQRLLRDVGAWDPTIDSVTKHFYDSGWCGINIEPHPAYFARLQTDRTRDINLNCAISTNPEERPFYVFDGTGVSTFDEGLSEHFKAYYSFREITVPTRTLADALTAAPEEISFLKVDAEGWEEQVLMSNDWVKYRPIILVIEALDPRTNQQTGETWHDFLVDNGYEKTYFDGLNRFYLRRESLDLRSRFGLPPNLFDNFVRLAEHEQRIRLGSLEHELQTTEAIFSALNRDLNRTAQLLGIDHFDTLENYGDNGHAASALAQKSRYIDTLARRIAARAEDLYKASPDTAMVEKLRDDAVAARIWAGQVTQMHALKNLPEDVPLDMSTRRNIR